MHICEAVDVSGEIIEIDHDSQHDLSQLPESTSILRLCQRSFSGDIFKSLPRGIKELYITGNIFYATESEIEQLPPRLRVLHIYGSDRTPVDHYKKLPSSIYELVFDDEGILNGSQYLQYLPKTLRNLTINMSVNTGHELHIPIKESLPYLKHLTIKSCKITNEFISELPDTLTSLDISGYMRLSSGWSSLLCRDLQDILFTDRYVHACVSREQLLTEGDRQYYEDKILEIFYDVGYDIDGSEYHSEGDSDYFSDSDSDYNDMFIEDDFANIKPYGNNNTNAA